MLTKNRKYSYPVALVLAGFLVVASSGVNAQLSCLAGAEPDPIFDLSFDFLSGNSNNVGGVSLNKTLTLLNELDDIRGAVYDPVKGEIVLIGQGLVGVNEQIDLDDLVVAVQSVYNNQDPGITFYTPNQAEAFRTGQWDVNYFGAARGTQFGQILFDADLVLRNL